MGKIAILGYGTVGSGVAEVFLKNHASIEKKCGRPMQLGYILDRKDLSGDPLGHLAVGDFQRILDDPEVEVVVETMGGLEPAFSYVTACLQAGKNVVTSNKELVAAKGAQLLELARQRQVNFLFEASVGGGIPIIHPLYQCLDASCISEVAGILNGTTNYILTRMFGAGEEFGQALRQAQDLGYAERDPAADVQGWDACRKICILASLVFGVHVFPEEVPTRGIDQLAPADVACARAWGYGIKLIGRAKREEDGRLFVAVEPMLLPQGSQLAHVDDVFNGILVRGGDLGDVVFYGRGAGKLPTASAVISDVVEAAKANGNLPGLYWKAGDGHTVSDSQQEVCRLFVRARGALEQAGQLLKPEKVLQQGDGSYSFFTGPGVRGEWMDRLGRCGARIESVLRVLEV